MGVQVELIDGKFSKSWMENEQGKPKDIVTRNGLLTPEFGEEYAGTELEVSYQVHKNTEKRKLTELEVKLYRLSINFPESYSKIADVLRKTNPTVLAVMVHLSNLIAERRKEQIDLLHQQFEMLQITDYQRAQDLLHTLKENDEPVWSLLQDLPWTK